MERTEVVENKAPSGSFFDVTRVVVLTLYHRSSISVDLSNFINKYVHATPEMDLCL